MLEQYLWLEFINKECKSNFYKKIWKKQQVKQ
jgi:hypothetical protein